MRKIGTNYFTTDNTNSQTLYSLRCGSDRGGYEQTTGRHHETLSLSPLTDFNPDWNISDLVGRYT